MTSWLSQSYMGRRGVAKGVPGRRHELTEAKQGTYHYVYGPYAEPVLRIAPGDIVVAETKDAFEGKIKSESDSPTKLLHIPFLTRNAGRLLSRVLPKATFLRPHSLDQATRSATDRYNCVDPRIWRSGRHQQYGLAQCSATGTCEEDGGDRERHQIQRLDHASIRTIHRYSWGAPEIEAITSLQPDYYGGNMDLPDVAPGAIVYFPVHHADAYLYLGDCHATQGDGELCGVAVRWIRPRSCKSI